jgi:hypothetical protein
MSDQQCRKLIHMATAIAGAVDVIRRLVHNLHSSLNSIRVIEWAGYVTLMIHEFI